MFRSAVIVTAYIFYTHDDVSSLYCMIHLPSFAACLVQLLVALRSTGVASQLTQFQDMSSQLLLGESSRANEDAWEARILESDGKCIGCMAFSPGSSGFCSICLKGVAGKFATFDICADPKLLAVISPHDVDALVKDLSFYFST